MKNLKTGDLMQRGALTALRMGKHPTLRLALAQNSNIFLYFQVSQGMLSLVWVIFIMVLDACAIKTKYGPYGRYALQNLLRLNNW